MRRFHSDVQQRNKKDLKFEQQTFYVPNIKKNLCLAIKPINSPAKNTRA